MKNDKYEKHLTEIFGAAKNAMLEHLKNNHLTAEEIANFAGVLAIHCYEIANEIKPKKTNLTQLDIANMHTEPRDIS